MTDFAPDVPSGHNYDVDNILTCKVGAGGVTKGQLVKVSATAPNNFPTTPVVIATAASGDKALGCALKTGALDDYVPVLIDGVAKIQAGGAITAGAAIKATSAGEAIAALNTLPTGAVAVTSNAATPTVESGVGCGRSLQAPAADNDTFVAIINGTW